MIILIVMAQTLKQIIFPTKEMTKMKKGISMPKMKMMIRKTGLLAAAAIGILLVDGGAQSQVFAQSLQFRFGTGNRPLAGPDSLVAPSPPRRSC